MSQVALRVPLVSCIIPTFNRVDFLKEAVESIQAQTLNEWELIIVDDGSVDNTMEVIFSYCKADKRIRYYRNPGKGGSSARNYGLKLSHGEYIAFLDDDDISLPHRFASQLSAAKRSGNDFIVSGYEVRDRRTNKVKSEVRLELKGYGAGFPSRWLIKRELLKKVNGFDEEFPSMQDIELSYRLSQHEVFALHDDIVTIIYPTNNSVSTKRENVLRGKTLLMDRSGSNMHPVEAAWWYFNIGNGYYNMGEKDKAIFYYKTAIRNDPKLNYRLGRLFVSCMPFSIKTGKYLIKILSKLSNSNFPALIEHLVIKA